MAAQGVWPAETVRESREEPVWLAPRQMPQLAPLFARMMLSKSQNDKIVTTLDAGLQPATGRSGADMERAVACTQFVGDDRRRSYRYERARLGRIGRP
ncbi:penicillin-binding protein 1C [Salmonella enterica subsp. enterica]|nr:penicillin-binding protein 1C [Salmonella enterica subsp. enterica]